MAVAKLVTKKYKITPISQEEFEILLDRLKFYPKIIEAFLAGNDKIVEITVENMKTQILRANLRKCTYTGKWPIAVYQRDLRVFLVKKEGEG